MDKELQAREMMPWRDYRYREVDHGIKILAIGLIREGLEILMAAVLRGFAALARLGTARYRKHMYPVPVLFTFFHVRATACAGTCEKPGVAECGGLQ